MGPTTTTNADSPRRLRLDLDPNRNMADGFVEILERIRQLEILDDSYSELLKAMQALAKLAPMSVASVHHAGVKLYRSTTHHRVVPERIEDIWYPPAEAVTEFGRANRPRAPIFYCCSDPTGAFLEAQAKVGNYAAFATWETTTDMILHHIGYSDSVMARAGIDRELLQVDRNLNERLRRDGLAEIRDFFSMAFTAPHHNLYRTTAAIAELFLSGDRISGIKYPSVAKHARVDNLALRPEFVRSGLALSGAVVVRIDEVSQQGMEGTEIARLASKRDGTLIWDYAGDSETTLKPGETVAMVVQPGETKRILSAGRLDIDGNPYDVFPGYSIELVDGKFVVFDLKRERVDPV
jgi:hypothetical protein